MAYSIIWPMGMGKGILDIGSMGDGGLEADKVCYCH